MKKILLASTMLAGSAGFAAAEVAVTGYAEMGIWSNSVGDIAFWQDVEVTFTMSGTTDGGLEFGAAIDLDETNVALNDDSGTTVYISGSFGKLTMGDTDGAIDWALQDAAALTSIADDHTTHVAWFGATGLDGEAFARKLLREKHVAVMPGSSFGENAAGFLRLSLTVPDDILIEAVGRIADLGQELTGLSAKRA